MIEKPNYNSNYYYEKYTSPLYTKLKISKLYYLWLALFCIIIPAKLNRKSKVLDVGCGVGNLVWALRFFGINAWGIEPSVGAKKFCVAKNFCRYKKYDKLPFKNNSFDLVFTNEVLEHIEINNLNKTVKEMERVSKGIMIHMIGVKDRGLMVENDPTHKIIKPESWWGEKLIQIGYKVKKGNLFYFFPHILPPKINTFNVKKGYFFIRTRNINKNPTQINSDN